MREANEVSEGSGEGLLQSGRSKGERQVIQWPRPEGFVHTAVLSRELHSPFLGAKVCFISFASED